MMRRIIAACVAQTLVLLSVYSAENDPECQPSWVWEWKDYPELGISGPTTVPDSCIGVQISVGPAVVNATSGVKRQRDVNACDPGNLYRNETTVPLSPDNSWILYLGYGNATPNEGNGTTATFTPNAAGEYVVQFQTEDTISSPYWSSGPPHPVHRTDPFKVFEVQSFEPMFSTIDYYYDPQDINKRIVLVSYKKNSLLNRYAYFQATPNPSIGTLPSGAPDESQLPSCWNTITGGNAGNTKIFSTVDRRTVATSNLRASAGTSYKEIKVIVYDAKLNLYADEGDRSIFEVGHSWWRFDVSNNDVLDYIDPQLAVYANEYGGFWPSDMNKWYIVHPGETKTGSSGASGGHLTTGLHIWRGLERINFEVGLSGFKDDVTSPGDYRILVPPARHCTTVAVDRLSDIGQGFAPDSTPWALSDWLNPNVSETVVGDWP